MYIEDRFTVSSKRVYTDQGFLIVPATISRTGIQLYKGSDVGLTGKDSDREISVYRSDSEVFDNDSMRSFANKPVTNDHPPVLVDAANAKQFSVGLSGNEVTKGAGNTVLTTLVLTDKAVIEAVDSGKVEISNGYTADIEFSSGITPTGEQYEAVQKNIRGNHIAIVNAGRAGAGCKISDKKTECDNDMKITIDGIDFEVSEQAGQAVTKLQNRLFDAEKEIEKKDEEEKEKDEEMKKKEEESKKTEDSLKAKLDDSKSKVLTDADIDARVADRVVLIDKAKTVYPALEWEGKSDKEIKAEIVTALCDGVDVSKVSDDYVSARFDILVEDKTLTPDNPLNREFENIKAKKTKDSRPLDVIAREKMIVDNREAWKNNGSKK